MTTEPTGRLLLTPRDAAKALAVSERTLWAWTKSGVVPAIKVGRTVRYSVADLRQWIALKTKGGDA